MALTPSSMVPLGTAAPDFNLPDPSGEMFSLGAVAGKSGLLVVFMCNHCPYVIHLHDALAELGRKLEAQGVGMVGINSNDYVKYPADSPAAMAEEIVQVGYTFPYLIDESQAVAKAYQATCTPDFFLYDAGLSLVYRGQYDGSRPGNDVAVTGEDLYAAIDALVTGAPPREGQRPSMGCNIKWRG